MRAYNWRVKGIQSKRLKQINYDSVNENRLIWKENDQNEFEQALEEIEEQESNKEDEEWSLIN